MIAVSTILAHWQVNVDLGTGRATLYRDHRHYGRARYRGNGEWCEFDPDTGEAREALELACGELKPFDPVLEANLRARRRD
ncbi:MAG TPA: hypothetical protein VEL07_15375 [Planctomycetota bacterium]|nr:hypothetical protein [Planctomycetota bacterium]